MLTDLERQGLRECRAAAGKHATPSVLDEVMGVLDAHILRSLEESMKEKDPVKQGEMANAAMQLFVDFDKKVAPFIVELIDALEVKYGGPEGKS